MHTFTHTVTCTHTYTHKHLPVKERSREVKHPRQYANYKSSSETSNLFFNGHNCVPGTDGFTLLEQNCQRVKLEWHWLETIPNDTQNLEILFKVSALHLFNFLVVTPFASGGDRWACGVHDSSVLDDIPVNISICIVGKLQGTLKRVAIPETCTTVLTCCS